MCCMPKTPPTTAGPQDIVSVQSCIRMVSRYSQCLQHHLPGEGRWFLCKNPFFTLHRTSCNPRLTPAPRGKQQQQKTREREALRDNPVGARTRLIQRLLSHGMRSRLIAMWKELELMGRIAAEVDGDLEGNECGRQTGLQPCRGLK